MFQFQFQLELVINCYPAGWPYARTTYIHLEPFVGCYVQIYVPADRSHTTLRLVSNFGSQQSNENVLEYNWQDTAGLWEWERWIKDASHLKSGEVKMYLHHTVSVNLGTVLMPVSNTGAQPKDGFCLVSTEYTYLVPKVRIHACDYSSGKGAKLYKLHKKQQTLTGSKGILLNWM